MKTPLRLLFAALGFWAVFLPGQAGAQMNEAERARLLDLSRELNRQYLEHRKEVEEYAIKHRLPLEVRDGDRVIAVLDRIINGQAVYTGSVNANAIRSLSANRIRPGGNMGLNLSGNGQLIGLWESANVPRATHQELTGSLVIVDAVASDSHATHVAGTIVAAGVMPNAQGFAPNAVLRCYNSANDAAEMAAEAAMMNPIVASNHSYGSFAGWDQDSVWRWFGNPAETTDWKFGAYTGQTQGWDNVAFNAPFYLIVKSAGNDRNDVAPPPGTVYFLGFSADTSSAFRNSDGLYDCIPTAGTAKNIVTVGAVNDLPGGYGSPAGVTMSTFSAWGPTDDGRIKPDVVANGVGLLSSIDGADDAYGTLGGTSMSAPSVTGTVALLQEHWGNLFGGVARAATMKGLLIHQADESGPDLGPDYAFGWGLVNAADAAELLNIHRIEGCEQIVEGALSDGETFEYSVWSDGFYPLKATVVWHDPPSPVTNGATLNPPGAVYLVNDLDLRIVQPDGVSALPWVLDPAAPANAATTGNNTRDNVEQVLILSPQQGAHTVRVSAPATVAAGPQQFSLLLSGNGATTENATYSGLMINDQRTFAVRRNLVLGPDFVVTGTGDVRAYAGESIRMVPGFHARAGSRFLARILPGGACDALSGALKTDNYPGIGTALPADLSRVDLPAPATPVARQSSVLMPVLQCNPNPASDFITLHAGGVSEGLCEVTLHDVYGRKLRTLYKGHTGQLPGISLYLDRQLPGLYAIRLTGPDGISTVPLVIQHP